MLSDFLFDKISGEYYLIINPDFEFANSDLESL